MGAPNFIAVPGPGDGATWPAYAGHPNDPRCDAPEITEADVSLLAYDLSRDPASIGDALEFLPAEGWEALCKAIAQRDAESLLRTCIETISPVLRDLARARLEASS